MYEIESLQSFKKGSRSRKSCSVLRQILATEALQTQIALMNEELVYIISGHQSGHQDSGSWSKSMNCFHHQSILSQCLSIHSSLGFQVISPHLQNSKFHSMMFEIPI